MKKGLRNTVCFMSCFLLLAGTLWCPAASFSTYTYSYWGEPVASPAGLVVEATYNGRQLGVGKLVEPKDLYIADNGEIFIADSGNDRILQFDSQWTVKKIWQEIEGVDGKKDALKSPSGIFVDTQNRVYIADTGNKRVLQCDMTGKVLQTYSQPKNDVQFTGIDYLPHRVLVDESGYVYVLCQGIYQGALVYENTGLFTGYYGTNSVEAGLLSALQLLWKRLMTDEQRSKSELFLPEEFTSFDMDDEGFVYTVTEVVESSQNQIKRINPLGVDVLVENQRISPTYQSRYGDLELRWYGGKILQTRFVDISYDSAGFVNALDRERGRIFQYDTEGNLLFVAGGTASQEGTFKKASAIDNYGERIFVLDEQKANITVFYLTDYGQDVRTAVNLYIDGRFVESKSLWEQVLQRNTNCEIAYAGIGKALYEEGQYKEAMTYFRKGYDRSGYDKAFTEYRMICIRQFAPWIGSAVLLAVVVVFVWKKIRQLRKLSQMYQQ